MSNLFDTEAIKRDNPPLSVLERLGCAVTARGRRLHTLCPQCGKKDKFDMDPETARFNCFTCDLGGNDVISLIMQVHQIDFIEACKWLGGVKALTAAQKYAAGQRRKERADRAREQEKKDHRRKRDQMKRVLKDVQPGAGTLAEDYLRGRGLGPGLDWLGWPEDLLFHPELPAFAGDGKKETPEARQQVGIFPTLVARGRDGAGRLVILHRTFLQPHKDKGAVKAAPVLPAALAGKWKAKQILGLVQRCDRGIFLGSTGDISENPLACVFVAEGIESALSVASAIALDCRARGLPEKDWPACLFYAGVSLNRIVGSPSETADEPRGWTPPPGRPVVIACDNDLSPTVQYPDDPKTGTRGGEIRARILFARAKDRLDSLGHKTALWMPPLGMDPNDALHHLRDPVGSAAGTAERADAVSAKEQPDHPNALSETKESENTETSDDGQWREVPVGSTLAALENENEKSERNAA